MAEIIVDYLSLHAGWEALVAYLLIVTIMWYGFTRLCMHDCVGNERMVAFGLFLLLGPVIIPFAGFLGIVMVINTITKLGNID